MPLTHFGLGCDGYVELFSYRMHVIYVQIGPSKMALLSCVSMSLNDFFQKNMAQGKSSGTSLYSSVPNRSVVQISVLDGKFPKL